MEIWTKLRKVEITQSKKTDEQRESHMPLGKRSICRKFGHHDAFRAISGLTSAGKLVMGFAPGKGPQSKDRISDGTFAWVFPSGGAFACTECREPRA